MIYLLLLPVVIILVGGSYLVFKAKPGRTRVYSKSYTKTEADRQLEDLHRQQTHMFWRDFGE